MIKTRDIIHHLLLIPHVGPGAIQRIINNISSIDELYLYKVSDITALGFTLDFAQKLIEGLQDKKTLEQEKQLLEKHNIQFITILDTQYPALLKEIHLPPSGLYIQGSFSSKKNMAIIGSRKANEYGRKVIHNLIPELVAHEWTIVSGGALGADTFAHEETLINNGKTIAILGSGLLQPYPLRNKKLFNIILEKGGAVASPFPLQMLPQPGNFPARNRIISGLSKGCIVAQAAEKSGASITAHFALEQGREVFAVPGIIDDPLSVGCHRLIQEGAKLITHVNDILEEFGEYSAPKKVPEKKQAEEVQNSIPAQKEITHPILKHCKKTISIDELHQETGLTIFELQQQLFELQLEGKVQQNFMGMWELLS